MTVPPSVSTSSALSPARPAVSVVVACYNAADFLERCVVSILGQTCRDIEILLVDDCSTDTTPALARVLAAAHPQVRLIESPTNGGPGAARNRGFAAAIGRWVAIVDSDDVLHPARLATLLAAADAAPDAAPADMIADDLLVFEDGSAAPATRFLKPADRAAPFDLDLAEYLRRSPLYGAEPNLGFLKPMILRERLHDSGVTYDETLRIAEDDDLVARLLLSGLRYRIVPTPLYFYRKHGKSISHRLSVATIAAMRAANMRLTEAILSVHPALAGLCAARTRSFARVGAFERAIADLKERRIGAALLVLLRAPGAWPLLRMPLAAAARKLAWRRTVEPMTLAATDELEVLRRQSDRTLS